MGDQSEPQATGSIEAALHRVVRELIADGAEAVVLAGSHARGEATDLSDIDLYAIGTGPRYALRLVDGRLFSVSWRTEAEERDALRRPARAGAVVPGWRGARILHDATGIAAALRTEARAFEWSAIAAECDVWVASEVTGYAEEVLKLVAARRAGDWQLAAVQRSILALRLPLVMAVLHRLLYDSENRLWAMVGETIGEGWSTAHRSALGLGDPAAALDAALMLYGLAAEEVDQLLSAPQRAIVRFAVRAAVAPPDPYAPMKELAWREVAEIDARLERGDNDEAGWHEAIARLIVPAYLAAETPWGGSGKQGTVDDWEYARSHIAHAIDRPGSFLDVGCANGYLLECLPRWTPHAVDRYGLDIAAELVDLAHGRLPELTHRLYVGNGLHWEPPHPFTYVRTGLEYVPRHRRRELVDRLLAWCERLIVGVFNEESHARPTEELLRSWGFPIAGRSERSHRTKAGMEYRVLWIDSP